MTVTTERYRPQDQASRRLEELDELIATEPDVIARLLLIQERIDLREARSL